MILFALSILLMSVPRNPHSIVIVGGRRFDTWKNKQTVKRVEVELASDMSSEATFTLFDPRFKILDSLTGDDGVAELVCLVFMGFGEDLGEPVFKGLLQRVERGDAETTFIVRDMGVKMRRELKNEFHQGIDDLAIIKKLATRNGLAFSGPDDAPSLEKHPSMPQDSRNDWEHTMERARASGFNIFVRQDTLFCKNPAKITAPILTLRYRPEGRPRPGEFSLAPMLHDFALTYKLPENQQGRPRVVHAHGRKRGGRRLVGESKQHSRGHHPVKITRDFAEHTKLYANRRAHAHKELQREPNFNCSIWSVPPLPGVRPDVRNTIALENLGKLFSGPYVCDKVTHTHTATEFRTEYNLYRDIAGGSASSDSLRRLLDQ